MAIVSFSLPQFKHDLFLNLRGAFLAQDLNRITKEQTDWLILHHRYNADRTEIPHTSLSNTFQPDDVDGHPVGLNLPIVHLNLGSIVPANAFVSVDGNKHIDLYKAVMSGSNAMKMWKAANKERSKTKACYIHVGTDTLECRGIVMAKAKSVDPSPSSFHDPTDDQELEMSDEAIPVKYPPAPGWYDVATHGVIIDPHLKAEKANSRTLLAIHIFRNKHHWVYVRNLCFPRLGLDMWICHDGLCNKGCVTWMTADQVMVHMKLRGRQAIAGLLFSSAH